MLAAIVTQPKDKNGWVSVTVDPTIQKELHAHWPNEYPSKGSFYCWPDDITSMEFREDPVRSAVRQPLKKHDRVLYNGKKGLMIYDFDRTDEYMHIKVWSQGMEKCLMIKASERKLVQKCDPNTRASANVPDFVLIDGLKGAKQYNGMQGCVVKPMPNGRWDVGILDLSPGHDLDSIMAGNGKHISLKPKNLFLNTGVYQKKLIEQHSKMARDAVPEVSHEVPRSNSKSEVRSVADDKQDTRTDTNADVKAAHSKDHQTTGVVEGGLAA